MHACVLREGGRTQSEVAEKAQVNGSIRVALSYILTEGLRQYYSMPTVAVQHAICGCAA